MSTSGRRRPTVLLWLPCLVGRQSVSDLLDTARSLRSRVSFFMNKFCKLGFIDYNRELHVHSSFLNIVLHN